MSTQSEKGAAFRGLHERAQAFIIPNPWDAGTAKLLAHLGFEALATTSAGYAFSQGKADNTVDRAQMMAHASDIVAATDLPVSGDLENGYGDAPEFVAETIHLAAASGLAGASIEDVSRGTEHRIYDKMHAAERIRAAAEAAHSLPFPFTLTARAENFLNGRPDLNDTIERLHAYQEAGADVLYAPGITTREQITTIVSSVDRPVNFLTGVGNASLTLAELSEIGVRRVSVGSALSRVALGAFLRAAEEMREHGVFRFEEAASYEKINSVYTGL
jgi:2-methylisocitrate lyase-like PEP mutase family enzyme